MSHTTVGLIERAKAFATAAHAGQPRKYTEEPYIVHPERVAWLVSSVEHTDEMVAAAWLHDTVEDNPTVELRDIFNEFGPEVASLVSDLTDISQPEDGNRAVRKHIDLRHTAVASPEAKTIKLADLIDNTSSIAKHDPGFARVYLREKAALLEVLKDGNRVLWQIANKQLEVWNGKFENARNGDEQPLSGHQDNA